ncbi:hypothetical protein GCM10022383_03340 [Microbacterium soli]|uniref:HTH luxR-type domain-containing protein n=1 Tax=Microbacterium soli TaxID=446075 RepID=A0ABP7MPP6_9MICO
MQRLHAQAIALRQVAVTPSHTRVVQALIEITQSWTSAPEEVYERHTNLLLSAIPSPSQESWHLSRGPLTPLIEAYLQGQQVGLLMMRHKLHDASVAFLNALLSLPMTHIGAGISASAARTLAESSRIFSPVFADVLDAIRPTHRITTEAWESHAHLPGVEAPAGSSDQFRSLLPVNQTLTRREDEVLDLVAEGYSNREIGTRLGISGRTVEMHLSNIYRKFNVGSRVELVSLLLR